MLLRFVSAALLTTTCITTAVLNIRGMLNVPNSVFLHLYIYGLSFLGLAVSCAFVYEALTKRRVNGIVFGGCFFVLSAGGILGLLLDGLGEFGLNIQLVLASACLASLTLGVLFISSFFRGKKR